MNFEWNELGARRLLNSPTGPVMNHIIKLGQRVEVHAKNNTSQGGEFPFPKGDRVRFVSGELHNNIQMNPVFRASEPYVEIGSTGARDGYAYPTHLEQTGWTWLTGALRRVFPEG